VVSSSNAVINGSRFIGNIEAGVHLMDCPDGGIEVTNNAFSVDTSDDGVLLERCLAVKVILDFQTEYTVTVKGRDLAGNNMSEFQWTFRTESPMPRSPGGS
jgi:hypothetical protein